MKIGRVLKIVLVGVGLLACVVSAPAQQIRYFPDFTSVAGLNLIGATQATWNSQQVLRIPTGSAVSGNAGAVWFTIQQPVNTGFTTYFRFQIHGATCCNPGEGLAFVVQNASSTDPSYGATGAGATARGVGNGGLGYAGIPNSVAVEFDTVRDLWDPTSNHVAVQSCGTSTNGPVHIPGKFTIGRNTNVTSCLVGALTGTGAGIYSPSSPLGVTCNESSCSDGVPHDVVIEYTAPAQPSGTGTLMVWIDPQFIPGTHTPLKTAVPAINIPYNIDNRYNSKGISLAGNTSAWVGFTASETGLQQQDILAWEFTPHTATQVQQVVQGCAPTNPTCQPAPTVFTFGGHVTKVTYFQGFVNNPSNPGDPYLMTVLATPWARSTFYQQRLKGTSFSNEQCVVYLGTGNSCMVYSITCQLQSNPTQNVTCPASLPNTCNNVGDPGCIVFNNSFYTADGITVNNADYLATDPIGSNNWQSIFVSYQPSVFDGNTTGKKPTPSDFVTTFKVGAKP